MGVPHILHRGISRYINITTMHNTKLIVLSIIAATCTGILVGSLLTARTMAKHADYTMSEAQAIAYCTPKDYVAEDDFTISYSRIGDTKPFIVKQHLRDGTYNIVYHADTKQHAQGFITGALMFNN